MIPAVLLSRARGIETIVDHLVSQCKLLGIAMYVANGVDDARCADAEIVLADPGLVALSIDCGFPKMRWLASTFAGVDAIVHRASAPPLARTDFQLTRCTGAFGPLITEYTFAYILERERFTREFAQSQAHAQWTPRVNRPLSTLSLGILGASGDIGRSVAQASKVAFGMHVVGVGLRERITPPEHCDEYFCVAQLPEALSRVDYLLSVLPSTPQTAGLLNGDMLSHCSSARRPVLINCGRGSLIAEADLLHALDKQWLSHAVLDVFAIEPLPSTSALYTHPAVTITPHVAALSFPSDLARIFLANAARYVVDPSSLHHLVDFKRGY